MLQKGLRKQQQQVQFAIERKTPSEVRLGNDAANGPQDQQHFQQHLTSSALLMSAFALQLNAIVEQKIMASVRKP